MSRELGYAVSSYKNNRELREKLPTSPLQVSVWGKEGGYLRWCRNVPGSEGNVQPVDSRGELTPDDRKLGAEYIRYAEEVAQTFPVGLPVPNVLRSSGERETWYVSGYILKDREIVVALSKEGVSGRKEYTVSKLNSHLAPERRKDFETGAFTPPNSEGYVYKMGVCGFQSIAGVEMYLLGKPNDSIEVEKQKLNRWNAVRGEDLEKVFQKLDSKSWQVSVQRNETQVVEVWRVHGVIAHAVDQEIYVHVKSPDGRFSKYLKASQIDNQ